MLNVNQDKVEKFFDVIDQSTMIIYESTRKNYLDSLLITCDNILSFDVESDIDVDVEKLNNIYSSIEEEAFNKEEIRKAFQLAMLKAFKHLDMNISDITPDSIGILFSYFIDKFFKNRNSIDIFDATVGTGNLLLSTMNNSNIQFNKIYGVDINSTCINIALRQANLACYEIEFINQNNLKKMLVPKVDLIISDLPSSDETDYLPNDLLTVKNNIVYKPYLMIENFLTYCKDGGYFIYLIPNDFFTHDKNDVIKEIILRDTYIQSIIELPLSLFKEPKFQKSILILQKKGNNILPNKEILMIRFPDFSLKDKVTSTIDKINQWFDNRHNK